MGAGASRSIVRCGGARQRCAFRGAGSPQAGALLKLRNPHDRDIFRLAIPAFVALVAEPLYLLVDTAVVGHLGTPELGGLAIAATILVSGYSLFIFLAYGTTGSVARLLGAGHPDRAAHQGVQALWLAATLGLALAVVGALTAELLVDALGATGEVRVHALTYLRISLIGLPALMISLAGVGYLRGLQDTRTPLFVTVGTNVLNLVLEVVLIYGLGYGIGASALATVVAQVAGAAIYVTLIAFSMRGSTAPARPDRTALTALLRVGLHLFLRTLSLRAVLVAATAVAARIGTADLAANQIALEVWNFLAFVLDAIAIAAQAIVGRLLGAGAADEARAAARRMIELGAALGLILSVGVLATRTLLAPLFSGDPEVIRLTVNLMLFVAIFQPINGVAFALDGVLIGAGDQRFLALGMAAAAAVFALGAAMTLTLDLRLGGLWMSLGTFMCIRAAMLLYRFATPKWQVIGSNP